MGDFGASVVRTVVPIIVGFLVALGSKAGLDMNSESLEGFLFPLVMSLYYIVARALESRWAAFGWLLGLPRPPTYPS
jgi:hypothetical protein